MQIIIPMCTALAGLERLLLISSLLNRTIAVIAHPLAQSRQYHRPSGLSTRTAALINATGFPAHQGQCALTNQFYLVGTVPAKHREKIFLIYFTRPAGKEPVESFLPVAGAKSGLAPSFQTGAGPGAVGDQSGTGGAVIHFVNVFVLHVGLQFSAFATWVEGLKPCELNAAMDPVWGELEAIPGCLLRCLHHTLHSPWLYVYPIARRGSFVCWHCLLK